jgi:site-specific recombinase XerD
MKAYLYPSDKDGMCRVYFNVRNTKLRTGIKILEDAWDHEKQVITSLMPKYQSLNSILLKRKSELSEILHRMKYERVPVTGAAIQQRWKDLDKPEEKRVYRSKLITAIIREYAALRKSKLSKEYFRKFEGMCRKLDEFRKVRADEFTFEVMSEFITWLLEDGEDGLHDNTVHLYVKRLRMIMRDASVRGEVVSSDWTRFRYRYIKPRPVWLTAEEVSKLEKCKVSKSLLPFKEEFLFRCYTGLRFSDSKQLRPHHFVRRGKDVILRFDMQKNKVAQSLMLSPKALAIAEKWKFKRPDIGRVDANREIKLICDDAGINTMVEKIRYSGSQREISILPKHQLITTHVARRTFGRIWMDKGGDILKLSKYYGHASVKQTQDYIGYTEEEIHDEVKRIMG